VPTKRARHVITETDQLARALDLAAGLWPAERGSRTKLLLRLVQQGRLAIEEDHHRYVAERRQAVAGTSGALTGAYGSTYLGELRQDWPS